MKTSADIGLLAQALATAQKKIRNPEKNKTAKIFSKRTNQSYSFNYADLPACFDTAREALAAVEISHSSATETLAGGEVFILTMRLMHSSGQWIESSVRLQGEDEKQVAAQHTYFRRYLFMGLCGIAGDEDLDGTPEGEYIDRTPRPKHNAPLVAQKQPTNDFKDYTATQVPTAVKELPKANAVASPDPVTVIVDKCRKLGWADSDIKPNLSKITGKDNSKMWEAADFDNVNLHLDDLLKANPQATK